MTRIDPNERCPECGAMGDHDKNCSKYPTAWKNCDGHVAKANGNCMKCGCPCF